MATVTITHATLTNAAADTTALVDGPKWDASHAVTGLESVDNTSDANKPVSTATQAALDVITAARPRTALTANRTYYVLTTGSDSNTGLANTAGGAFLTLQKAADVILNTLDRGTYNVVVDVTGAYTAGASWTSPGVGTGTITITSTAGASITTTSANCIAASAGCKIFVSGSLTLSTVTSGVCLVAYTGGMISFSGVTFGAAGVGHIQAGWVAPGSGGALEAGPGTMFATGNYTITGGGLWHLHSTNEGSVIELSPTITVTLTGTPAFSAFFAGVTKGLIYVLSATFSGAATGPRYIAHNGGAIIGAASRSSLPGNAAGSVASGGGYICVANDSDADLGFATLIGTNIAAPSTPAAGYVSAWADSTDKRFHDKNDAGTIGTTVVADAGAANQFLTAISAAGVVSKAQPTIGSIAGLGTGVATALGANVGSVGAPVVNGGALGSPSSVGTLPPLVPNADNTHSLGGPSARWLNVYAVNSFTAGASQIAVGAAMPAGGSTTYGFTAISSSFGIFFGSGVPTLSAAQGSLYLRSDGSSTSTRMYVNTNGSTGWTNVVTAA